MVLSSSNVSSAIHKGPMAKDGTRPKKFAGTEYIASTIIGKERRKRKLDIHLSIASSFIKMREVPVVVLFEEESVAMIESVVLVVECVILLSETIPDSGELYCELILWLLQSLSGLVVFIKWRDG